jgi:tetratricopeptide (TPR) repeat protein
MVWMVPLLAIVTSAHPHSSRPVQTASAVPGNEACASCHAEIYNSYSKTVMAHASGPAADGLITGEFLHKPSGVRYRVYTQDGRVWMSYERASEKTFRGQRELLYFIGSGVKGRTYLFSTDGFLFEAPINWYSQESKWNMTPAYTEAQTIPMNLPAYPSCLNCHTSGMQAPAPGTDSKFSGKPFAHDGITCERCHGSGNGHIEGKGAIVNPAKLTSERRDAICMECHFEGTAAVEQPGKHLYEFRPGERLSDYEHYFLLPGNQPQTAQALSQFEALSLSACKRQSGDRMWCGSCHDPHAEPSASEKAAYYRGKCLKCHGEAFATRHHADKPDCTSCHMPALPSKDVAHTEGTDHRILSYPTAHVLPRLKLRGVPLVAFPESDAGLATTRDFALAWQTLAQHGVDGAGQRAVEYLQKAVKERPDDPDLLSALAFLEQENGRQNEARESYERALKANPLNNEAATNLGMLEARAGNLRRAVELWQGAFARAPYRSAIGTNLALAFCAAGQRDDARKYVDRVLEFDPDYSKAKSLLKKMDAGQCGP